MRVLRVVFALPFLYSLFVSTAASTLPAEKPFIKYASGTMTNTLLENLKKQTEEKDRPQCALSLSNNMTSYRLINPFLYLAHGENPMPVSLKIDPDSSMEIVFKAAAAQKDSAGLLYYEIETTGHYLEIFWKNTGSSGTENRFYAQIIAAIKFSDKEESLQTTYKDIKSFSKTASDFMFSGKALGRVPGGKGQLMITIRAQMTTEEDGKLSFEIFDNLAPSSATQPYARTGIETKIAITVGKAALKFIYKQIMKHIPSAQTGNIEVENFSKDISLINPSWYIVSGHTSSFVPWEIKPSEKGTIEFLSPLGGTSVLKALDHTVHFLSYQIASTNYYLIIGSWFPYKITQPQIVTTIFVMEKKVEAQSMKVVLTAFGESLSQAGGDQTKFMSNLANNVKYKSFVQSIPDKKIVTWKASKLQRYREWQYKISTPVVMTKPGKEYHIKIVAAVSYGDAFGLSARVEVVAGPSKQAESFANLNPQDYKEPPQDQTTPAYAMELDSDKTAMMVSAMGGIATSGMSDIRQHEVARQGQTPSHAKSVDEYLSQGNSGNTATQNFRTTGKAAIAKIPSAKISEKTTTMKISGMRPSGRDQSREILARRRLTTFTAGKMTKKRSWPEKKFLDQQTRRSKMLMEETRREHHN